MKPQNIFPIIPL